MVVLVVLAHVAHISRRPCRRLQVLDTLAELARIGRLLLRLTLVRQIRLIVISRRQLALRWVPVLVHIDARVHLLCLLRGDGSSLGTSCCVSICTTTCHLVPLTLPRALNPIWLRVGADLRNLVVALSWCAISESLAHSKLLLEVFLGLLSYQFSSLWRTGASHRRATPLNIARIIAVCDGSILLILWFIR